MKKNIVIGLRGQKKSGKDTVCSMLTSLFAARHQKVAVQRFASKMKSMLAILLEQPVYMQNNQKFKDTMVYGKKVRDLQKSLGDWGRGIDSDFWLSSVKYSGTGIVIVPDLRFDNEYRHIIDIGGVVVDIRRESIEDNSPDRHTSEKIAFDRLPADYIINNNNTMQMLAQDVAEVFLKIVGDDI